MRLRGSILEYVKTICIIVLFAWASFFPTTVHGQYVTSTRIFFIFFLLVLILKKQDRKNLFSLKDWPLWLFLASLFSGTVFALYTTKSLETYYYLAITLFMLFYIGKSIFSSERDRRFVSTVICIFSIAIALYAMIEFRFAKNLLYENFIPNPYYERYTSYVPRPMATFLHPTILGTYLLCCLPFSLYLRRQKALYMRLLSIVSFMFSICVILLAASRGVLLSLIVLVLFYLWKRRRRRECILIIVCLVLFIQICSYQKDSNFYRFGFYRMITGGHHSILSPYRLNRVLMTGRILKDYPLFGIGFRHFRIRFKEYHKNIRFNEYLHYYGDSAEVAEMEIPYEFRIPDNMYLTFLAEAGVIGAGGFLLFIFLLLKRGLKQLGRLAGGEKGQALLVGLAAGVGLLFNMAAYDLFYWHNPYMLFCLICGFIRADELYIDNNNQPQ